MVFLINLVNLVKTAFNKIENLIFLSRKSRFQIKKLFRVTTFLDFDLP